MRTTFNQELLAIEGVVLEMGAFAEQSIAQAMEALRERDSIRALHIAQDTTAGDLRRQARSRLMAVMACQAPVARDLRFLLTVQVVVAEFEHISDQVVGIVQEIIQMKQALSSECALIAPSAPPTELITVLCDHAQALCQQIPICLQSLLSMNIQQSHIRANESQATLNRILALNFQLHERVLTDDLHGEAIVYLLLVAQRLESIGDCIRNICDDILYMVAGDAA